jgi:hypothetical protein
MVKKTTTPTPTTTKGMARGGPKKLPFRAGSDLRSVTKFIEYVDEICFQIIQWGV